MSEPFDPAAEGLLDGLDGRARSEREELLRWLHDEQDVSVEEMRDAVVPVLIASEQRLSGGGPKLTGRELAERSDLSIEFLGALRRAQGLPRTEDVDRPMFTDADLEVARSAKTFLDAGLAPEQVLATGRVLGRGLSQTAEVMRQTGFELALEPGATELQLAQAYAAVAGRLVPMLGPLVEQLLRLHLRQAVETEMVNESERAAGSLAGARAINVAFADLVGFTRLGEELAPDALERLADRLEALAGEVVEPPVRLVKSIGDAVMLVSPRGHELLDALFALLAAADGEGGDFPQLRAGMACGDAVTRAGDWYGRPVNLASRVTDVARAGSVLVTDEVREALGEDAASWSPAGSRRLKGIAGEVRLFRARPARPARAG